MDAITKLQFERRVDTMSDSLGDRMKENYENRAKTYLVRRMPVIIRIDGKAFHTFTSGFQRPYDTIFSQRNEWNNKISVREYPRM